MHHDRRIMHISGEGYEVSVETMGQFFVLSAVFDHEKGDYYRRTFNGVCTVDIAGVYLSAILDTEDEAVERFNDLVDELECEWIEMPTLNSHDEFTIEMMPFTDINRNATL